MCALHTVARGVRKSHSVTKYKPPLTSTENVRQSTVKHDLQCLSHVNGHIVFYVSCQVVLNAFLCKMFFLKKNKIFKSTFCLYCTMPSKAAAFNMYDLLQKT